MSAVNLSDAEWGEVMAIISEAPWRRANPLLMKIGEQLRAQHQPPGAEHAQGQRIDLNSNGSNQEVRS